MLLWKDVTSYKQGDRERKPTSYSTRVDWVKASITNSHITNKGRWSLSVTGMYDVRDMGLEGNVEPSEAILAAEKMIRECLESVLKALI